MPLKVTNVSDKKKAKFFTEGTPKDFVLTTTSSHSVVAGNLMGSGKAYNITINARDAQDAASLREIAEHFAELADILDKKIAA